MNNKPFFKTCVSFALVMLVIGPFLGLFHQENSKRIKAYQFHKNGLANCSPERIENLQKLLATIDSKVASKRLDKAVNQFIVDDDLRKKLQAASTELHDQTNFNRSEAYQFIRNQLGLQPAILINEAELTVYTHNLARVHGHAILIGSLIPLAMCIILFLTQQLNGGEITDRSLKFVSKTYIISASITLFLMAAKGWAIQGALKFGVTDIAQLENAFLPNDVARAIIYGLTHTVTFISLFYFVYISSKSLNMTPDITEEKLLKKKNVMIRINAFMWTAVGFMLIYRAFPLFPATSGATFYIAIAIGAIIGAGKGFFVLSKVGKKNVLRIEALEKPVLITQAIPLKLILLIPLMIIFGVLIRAYKDSIPGAGYTVGAIYIGIGTALLFSSRHYWLTTLKKKL